MTGQFDDLSGDQIRASWTAGSVKLVRADAIPIEPIEWLWAGWLAAGKFALLAGATGAGKTTLALAMAAIVSRSGKWPDGMMAPLGSVIMWSSEDDPADSIVPRFIACGGDVRKFHIVTGRKDAAGSLLPFDPAYDMAELAETAKGIHDLKLIILDPVLSAVAGNSHHASETRRGLQPVVDMAAELGAVVLGISHFAKASAGRDTIERVIGSQAFVALPRVVLAAARAAEPATPRRLVRAKSNCGPDGDGWEFELAMVPVPGRPDIQAQRVIFGAALQGSADQLLKEIETHPNDRSSRAPERTRAETWLADALADGPVASATLIHRAESVSISVRTLRRAAKNLGVRYAKAGLADGWTWMLPNTNLTKSAELGHPSDLAKLGKFEDGQLKNMAKFEDGHPDREVNFERSGQIRHADGAYEVDL